MPPDAATESPASPPSLMDAVKARINQIVAQNNVTLAPNTTSSEVSSPDSASGKSSPSKSLRLAGPAPAEGAAAGPSVDPTFWIPDSVVVGPDAYLAKTKEFLANVSEEKRAFLSFPSDKCSSRQC